MKNFIGSGSLQQDDFYERYKRRKQEKLEREKAVLRIRPGSVVEVAGRKYVVRQMKGADLVLRRMP